MAVFGAATTLAATGSTTGVAAATGFGLPTGMLVVFALVVAAAGLVLAAGAAGLPVIGTRDCGAEDAIDHQTTGLLVSQERLDSELPQAILRILTQPELAARMGAAGRRHD